MKKYTHESQTLNSLLGRRVKITFFDNTVARGILSRATYYLNYYHIEGIDSIDFRKSHIKKIEVEE